MAFLKMGDDLTNFAEVQGKLATAREANRELDAALTAANLRVGEFEGELSDLRSNAKFVQDRDKAVRGMISEVASEQAQRARTAETRVAVLEDANKMLRGENMRLSVSVRTTDDDAAASRTKADDALARVSELEHSLADAMEQIAAIQGSNAVHMARVEALESSMEFEVNDGMGTRISIACDPLLPRLIELVWPVHVVGRPVLERAIHLLESIDEVKVHAPRREVTDCLRCGWPLARSPSEGCVPGNCSQRPLPEQRGEGESR